MTAPRQESAEMPPDPQSLPDQQSPLSTPAVPVRGARVLLTGGAGLIGSTLADQLVDPGASDIVVVDDLSRGTRSNLASAMSKGPVRLIEADITDRALLR